MTTLLSALSMNNQYLSMADEKMQQWTILIGNFGVIYIRIDRQSSILVPILAPILAPISANFSANSRFDSRADSSANQPVGIAY